MLTRILPFADAEAQREALALLAQSAVIAAPTDTVYGIMARYDSSAAVAALFAVKERPPDKAIPILVGARDQLSRLVRLPLPPAALQLAERFWPGPLTLILPARCGLPAVLTAGQTTVGVRMPAHVALCALLQRSGPLAATSANLSGAAETHRAAQVARQLEGRLPLILQDHGEEDAGEEEPQEHQDATPPSPASTIVDLSGPAPRILRRGPIAAEVSAALAELGLPPC